MKSGVKITKKTVFELAQMIAGNAVCAAAMACFALPFNMVVGGVSGIGRMVQHYTGVSVSMTVTIINIGLFLIGAAMLGRKFAASIAVGTFAYPFFLGLLENIEALHHLVDDPLLAAICAGVLDGVGLGLVLRIGGSTGGIDVPSLILNRKLGWKIATVMSALDITIFLIQIPITSTNGIILGILYTLVYSFVMNNIILKEQGGVQVMIWSPKTEEINEALLELGFGTTLFKAQGGYLRENRDVICCAASNRTYNRVKRATLSIDPDAFLTITSMNEVNGNGFTMMLADEEYVPDIRQRHDGHELGESLSQD